MVVLLSGLPCTVLETGDPMGGSSCLTQWTGVPQHPAQSVQEVTSNNNSRSVIQVQFVTRSVQAGSRERVTAGGRRGPKPHQRYRPGGGGPQNGECTCLHCIKPPPPTSAIHQVGFITKACSWCYWNGMSDYLQTLKHSVIFCPPMYHHALCTPLFYPSTFLTASLSAEQWGTVYTPSKQVPQPRSRCIFTF